jgi:hypothetical protein
MLGRIVHTAIYKAILGARILGGGEVSIQSRDDKYQLSEGLHNTHSLQIRCATSS